MSLKTQTNVTMLGTTTPTSVDAGLSPYYTILYYTILYYTILYYTIHTVTQLYKSYTDI